LHDEEMQYAKSMIELFDSQFKFHLDRYKYHQRYNSEFKHHRVECDKILHQLDANVSKSIWFFSDRISLLDIAILPFIRQFKIANPEYFFNQSYQNIIKLLESFENSEIFESVMQKYDLWRPQGSSKPVLFPS
jgi:glutathione S-transferase